ncbi:MAG TPA: hypothetical protein VFX59_10315 [Polyangiales bacterium]|nr:hypothetical protein [Polyangiales bacterium]
MPSHQAPTLNPSPFLLEHEATTGYARFTNGLVSLVRFRSGCRWEYYRVVQRGSSRGLERFVRYLRTEEASRLEQAVASEEARHRLEVALASMTTQQALRGCAVNVVTGDVVD